MKNLKETYTQKLESSGISIKQAQSLGYELLTAEATEALGYLKVPAFKIPYYDKNKKPTKFYRLRYLESTKRGILKSTKAKDQRYTQPTGITTELYLPPIWKRKWVEEFEKGTALFITEGELKAACACVMGIPTMALGGVWNFCSRKSGVNILPVFKEITSNGRQIFIVFDSDAVTNPQVAQAENVFCKELLNLKFEPYIVRLPSLEGKKTGLDDYLLAEGVDRFKELVEAAEPFKLGAELHRLNEEVIYVENPSLVLRHKDNYKMGVNTFKNEVYANRTFIDFSGEKPRQVKTADEWVKWSGRAMVNGFVYEPGKPLYVEPNSLNLWRGLPYEPKKGDIKPWITLMDYVFAGDKNARQWFEAWLAYPLQHLGTKLFTAVVIWSIATGTGKTLIGHTMQRLYGENSIMIRKRDLLSGNNSFAENKQFILGEEITGDEKRGMVDELKSLITNEEMRINIKYVPEYSIRSCANYYFTSNNPDAFFLDETDRRFFVHEIVGNPLEESWYTDIYDKWYKSDEGAAALLYYLLHLPLGSFSPMSRAPMTRAKEEMIENSRSVLSNWVHALRENPDKVLTVDNAVLPQDLWTTEELLKLFDKEGKSRVGVRGMGVELKRVRLPKAALGAGCRTSTGQCRLWAVRNPEKYVKLSPAAVGKLYDEERKVEVKELKFSKKGKGVK